MKHKYAYNLCPQICINTHTHTWDLFICLLIIKIDCYFKIYLFLYPRYFFSIRNCYLNCSSSLRGTPSTEICIPIPRHNTTIITDVYAGIPENLLLNFLGFLVENFVSFVIKLDNVFKNVT